MVDHLRAFAFGSIANTLADIIDKDARLDDEQKEYLVSFLSAIGVITVDDLLDIDELQGARDFLLKELSTHEISSGAAHAQVKAGLGRLLRTVLAAKTSAEPPSAPPSQATIKAADDSTKAVLAGFLAGQGDTASLDKLLSSKSVSLRSLIDAAKYGEPCSAGLPSDDDLKRISAAADLGYAVPPKVCNLVTGLVSFCPRKLAARTV